MRQIKAEEFEKIYNEIKKIAKDVEITDLVLGGEKRGHFDIKKENNLIHIFGRDYFVDEEGVYWKNREITYNVPGKSGKAKGMPSKISKLLDTIKMEKFEEF